MTDTPYQGRRGGRYVRASRKDPPRRVEETPAAPAKHAEPTDRDAGDTSSETTLPEAGGKPARKRN